LVVSTLHDNAKELGQESLDTGLAKKRWLAARRRFMGVTDQGHSVTRQPDKLKAQAEEYENPPTRP